MLSRSILPIRVATKHFLLVSLVLVFSGGDSLGQPMTKDPSAVSPRGQKMRVRIQDSYDPLTSKVLDLFEVEEGLKLSAPYRSFLLERNGGYITNPTAECESLTRKGHMCWIGRFLGINTNEHFTELAEQREVLDKPLMKRFLAIGFSDSGDVFCLGIDDKYYGQVYFWDQEEAPFEDEVDITREEVLMSNMHLCGRDFTEFLHRLEHSAEDPIEPKETIPLLRAIETSDWPQVDKLLEAGADVNVANELGRTPLMLAIRRQNADVSRKLIEKGAKVQVRDKSGKSPIFLSITSHSFDNLRLLIEHGGNINDRDDRGVSLLISSIDVHNHRATEELLNRGVEVNGADKAGRTALSISKGRARERILNLGGR